MTRLKEFFGSALFVGLAVAVTWAGVALSRADAQQGEVIRTLTVQEVATVAPARARFTICRHDVGGETTCLTIVVTPRPGQNLADALDAWGAGVTQPDGTIFTYTN